MLIMYLSWTFFGRSSSGIRPIEEQEQHLPVNTPENSTESNTCRDTGGRFVAWSRKHFDLVNIQEADLYSDEHEEDEWDREEEYVRERRANGRWGPLWRLWYILA